MLIIDEGNINVRGYSSESNIVDRILELLYRLDLSDERHTENGVMFMKDGKVTHVEYLTSMSSSHIIVGSGHWLLNRNGSFISAMRIG